MTYPELECLKLERRGPVGWLINNRPDQLNAMSASATKWSPPPAQTPLTAAITGFQTWLCHAVSRSSASLV